MSDTADRSDHDPAESEISIAADRDMGHHCAMAKTVHQIVPLPRPIRDAQESVRAPIRIVLAHYLADHPCSRMGEIIAAIGGERHLIQLHLNAMEKIGVVTVTRPDRADTNSRWREYSLDHRRWTELLIRLINYLPSEPHSG